MEKITASITTEYIRLDALLTLADAGSSGGEAKLMIQAGDVSVNGEVCTQRGRKLRPGDTAELPGTEILVQ